MSGQSVKLQLSVSDERRHRTSPEIEPAIVSIAASKMSNTEQRTVLPSKRVATEYPVRFPALNRARIEANLDMCTAY